MEPNKLVCARLPTPLERLERYSRACRRAIWIKRDDETGFLHSGNKVRKLEFVLARALDRAARTVVTCGGSNSNHCRATAVLAARFGLACHLFLRTADGRAPGLLQGNTLLDHLAGATVTWITPDDYSRRDSLMAAYAAKVGATYVIPEGASDGLGAWGYAAAVAEIRDQLRTAGLEIDCVVHAMGSGGTTAGLLAGLTLHDVPWRIVGVPVCDDAAYFRERVRCIREDMVASGGPSPGDDSRLDIIDGYQGRGYALTTPEELNLIRDLFRQEGVLLDPCYTGKAFYAMDHEIKAGRWPEDTRILFLHTGGGFSNFSYAAQWAEVV